MSNHSTPEPLSYAALDADGAPEFDAQAEALIDQGESPAALKHLFKYKRIAEAYFAKSMRRHYGIDKVGHHCSQCDQPALFVATFDWRASAAPHLFGVQMIFSGRKGIPFKTFHSFCDPCFRSWIETQAWPRKILSLLHYTSWTFIIAYVGSILLRLVLGFPINRHLGSYLLGGYLVNQSIAYLVTAAFRRGFPPEIARIRRKGVEYTDYSVEFIGDFLGQPDEQIDESSA